MRDSHAKSLDGETANANSNRPPVVVVDCVTGSIPRSFINTDWSDMHADVIFTSLLHYIRIYPGRAPVCGRMHELHAR